MIFESGLKPFINCAGGKKQILDRLESRIPLEYNRYYEPFVGGGALFFDMLPRHATIGDTNECLINLFQCAKNNCEAVIDKVNKLDSVPCDKDRYYTVRDVYNVKIVNHEIDTECAALMIYLNKRCFNGLYRVNRNGLFNSSCGTKVYGSSIDADNFRAVGKYLRENDIEILNRDFEETCEKVQPGDFVYFDSPYIPESKTGNFVQYTKDGFTLEDHERLASLFKRLDGIGAKLMLSNNDVPLAHELYSGYHIEAFDARRSINVDGTRRKGREILVTNY